VTLAHLKLFVDIAESRSISKAAVKSSISQSAASQHLQELERQLDAQLIDRSVRPLVLTEAGQAYLSFCLDVIDKQEIFQDRLKQIKGQNDTSVRVASIYSVGLTDLSRIEDQFAALHAGIELRIFYHQPDKVYEAIRSERADLGLVSYPEPGDGIEVIPWRQERMAVAAAVDSPLAARVWLRPTDLEGQEFVSFDEGLPIAKAVNDYLAAAGVHVEKQSYFDNIASLREAVAAGQGISILPFRQLRSEVEAGRIAAIRLDNPPIYRPLGIIHLTNKRFNRAMQVFLDALREREPASVG
jgi:LysR family transcriptional regulator, transcriptional activator of the cysJI operon